MNIKIRFLLLASLIVLAGCGSQPAEELNKELKTISSWAATTRMVAEGWTSGRLPDAYAGQTFEAAGLSLQEESRTLGKSSDISFEKRQVTMARLDNLRQIIHRMRTAIESKDRAALSQLTGQLAAEEQALKRDAGGDEPGQ